MGIGLLVIGVILQSQSIAANSTRAETRALQWPDKQGGNLVVSGTTPKLAKPTEFGGVLECIIESGRRGLIGEGRRGEAVLAVLKKISNFDLQVGFEIRADQNTFQNFPTLLINAPELTHAGACVPAGWWETEEALDDLRHFSGLLKRYGLCERYLLGHGGKRARATSPLRNFWNSWPKRAARSSGLRVIRSQPPAPQFCCGAVSPGMEKLTG
jgi:hypothetical protein